MRDRARWRHCVATKVLLKQNDSDKIVLLCCCRLLRASWQCSLQNYTDNRRSKHETEKNRRISKYAVSSIVIVVVIVVVVARVVFVMSKRSSSQRSLRSIDAERFRLTNGAFHNRFDFDIIRPRTFSYHVQFEIVVEHGRKCGGGGRAMSDAWRRWRGQHATLAQAGGRQTVAACAARRFVRRHDTSKQNKRRRRRKRENSFQQR